MEDEWNEVIMKYKIKLNFPKLLVDGFISLINETGTEIRFPFSKNNSPYECQIFINQTMPPACFEKNQPNGYQLFINGVLQ